METMTWPNRWLHSAWFALAILMSPVLSGPVKAEITQIVVNSANDMGPFRSKIYREVHATMKGKAPGGAYSVPVVLAFPVAAADYNGFALVDVLNTVTVGNPQWVVGGRILPVARLQLGEQYLFGNGNFYVGVLWDKVAAEFFHTGTIVAPADGYEILRDAARLARNPAAAHFPLGFPLPSAAVKVIAYGYSQTGTLLRGFYVQRLNTAKGDVTFDGAVIGGARGSCRNLNAPGVAGCEGPLADGGKVIAVNPEGDAEAGGFRERGETRDYRAIEVAGVSHLPVALVDFRGVGVPRQNPVDFFPVMRAALTNLQGWIRGTEPPPSAYITLQDGPAKEILGQPLKDAVRDRDGNAVDGLRLPHLPIRLGDGRMTGAPLGTYKGLDLDFKDANRFFLISGTFVPFAEDRLRALYPTREAYVSAVSLAAKDLVSKRYILQEDADAYIRAAVRSDTGR
jgi:Alpha/beta hydrolase domain